MTGVMTLYRSSIGKKALMAITGVIGIGFVFIHMYGNLKIYSGADAFNHYAAALRTLGEPVVAPYHGLWIARFVLLGAVLVHIWAAATLWQQSNAGRPQKYNEVKRTQPAYTYAAYTMRWGGVLIAAFIVFHILHFTLGVIGYGFGDIIFTHPENGEYFAYQNVVNGFLVWPISLFYIIAQFFLALHIFHGTWSLFQTIGWNRTGSTSNFLRAVAGVVAGLILLGNISIPLAVMTGIVS